MKCTPIDTQDLGSNVNSWLWPRDLNFADSGHAWSSVLDVPTGFVSDSGWVVFLRRQVLLAVPDELHSYWHRDFQTGSEQHSSWLVEESSWLASFDQRHLEHCSHFVMELRDHVLEVIAEALLVGPGVFALDAAIEQHPALADAYYWRALERERQGDIPQAREYLRRVASSPDAFFAQAASRDLERIGESDR